MTDKDELIELIRNSSCVSTWDYHLDDFKDPDPILKLADYLLTNDMVKVVRCKDCKHCEHINDEFDKDWWQCKRRGNSFQRKPDDFCSYGELKECEGK